MKWLEGLAEAADAVRHNKLRTFLSLLGMIIGTASVVAVLAAGSMMSREFIDQADSIGARLIVVYNNWELNDYQTRPIYMSNRDVQALRELESGALFARLNSDRRKVVRGAMSRDIRIMGVDPEYWEIWPREFVSGRTLNYEDEQNLSKVCVITEDYAAAFFPDGNALGSMLTIDSFDYAVVGITAIPEQQSLMSDGTSRETIFIPYVAMERTTNWRWFGSPRVFEIMVRAESVARVPSTVNSIESYLNRMYGTIEGQCRFKVEAIEGALNTVRTIFNAVSMIIAFIAGISLLVSGIGIMNVMLVAVSERTREIGVRKAVGARSVDILIQFIIESLFVCMSGGLIGILLGMLIANGIASAASWTYYMPPAAPLIALTVSACVGLFFGISPAKSAAALEPVMALTKE